MRLAVIAAGSVLVLGIAGCGGSQAEPTDQPSSSTSQAAPADVKTAVGTEYDFSFEYSPPFEEQPETTWEAQTATSTNESLAVFDTSGTQIADQYRDAFVVNVYELNQPVTEEMLTDIAAEIEASVIPQLERSTTDMQIGDLVGTEVNGLRGFQADATFTVEGTPMRSTIYFLFDGDLEYQLLAQSSADRWAALEPSFAQMVDSFTVGSGASASPTAVQ